MTPKKKLTPNARTNTCCHEHAEENLIIWRFIKLFQRTKNLIFQKKKYQKRKVAAVQGTIKGCAWAGPVLPVPYDAAFCRLFTFVLLHCAIHPLRSRLAPAKWQLLRGLRPHYVN